VGEVSDAKRIELPLVPGALSDDTDLAVSLRAADMDKVRSRGKRYETIKGWTAFNASGMSAGKARGGYSWAALDGTPWVIMCSESAINAWGGGSRLTITPKWVDTFIDSANVLFTDNLVTIDSWAVYDPVTDTSEEKAHYLQVGDSVTLAGVPSTGGGYTANAAFTVASITSPYALTLTASGSTPGISSSLPGGYAVTAAFRSGLSTGTGDLVSQKARIYSVSNFGENAVFCGSDGTPIFYFQPASSYPEIISNGTFTGNANGWTLGSGGGGSGIWAYNTNKVTFTGSASANLSQSISASVTGGKTYELSFTVSAMTTAAAVSLSTKIDSIKIYPDLVGAGVGANGYNQVYTTRFVMPANPTNLVFSASGDSSTSTVTLDTISLKLLNIAHRLNEAPQKNYALFTDAANHVLHVLGSVEADGDFNPLLSRWSAQDNYRDWIPDTDNIAGELTLGAGSYGVCGGTVGGINVLLSDDAAFAAAFTANGYSLQALGRGCGALGAQSLAIHNNIAFWAGIKGFHAFDGARVLNIECPIKDRYVTKLSQYQENKTFAWINTEYGEVWFHYPHTTDGNETSRYAIYNFLEEGNPWSFGTFDRTTWIRPSVFQYPIAVDTSGNIWSHETSTAMSGSITLPFVETGYVTAGAGDRWLGCRRYYPDIEGQVGNITWTLTGKRRPQGTSDTQVITKTLTTSTSKADFLISMGQAKFKWASAATPTNWRLGVVGLEMKSERERR
jgi:hypothetical protein